MRRSSCRRSFGCTVKPSGTASSSPFSPRSSSAETAVDDRLVDDRTAAGLERLAARSIAVAQPVVRLAERRGRLLLKPADLLLGDDALLGEQAAANCSRTVGCSAIRAAISGCVYAASSCSLWPKRR